jgi:hypothetical protein
LSKEVVYIILPHNFYTEHSYEEIFCTIPKYGGALNLQTFNIRLHIVLYITG